MQRDPHKRTTEPPEGEGPMLLNPQQLLPGVDYLYCPDCGHHVGSIRLQPGVWEVQCSRCVGECGLCSCKTARICQGKAGTPVQTHTFVCGNK